MPLSDALRAHLQSLVDAHPVLLFMKGTRRSPQCGFSASAVGLLDALLSDYHTVDVLADPAVREGLKDFSDWPTFPQLYVRGRFVGGVDVLRELHARGELASVLGATRSLRVPTLHVSDAARRAFREAARDAGEAVLRLEVSAGFQHDLFFGDAAPLDVTVDLGDGLVMHLDPGSAHRADGVTIDHVVGASGAGFTIHNPHEPAKVRQLSPRMLQDMIRSGKRFEFVDVRTEEEWEIARIPGARRLDVAYEHQLLAMDRGTPLVFLCHHGVRSLHAAEHFLHKGFSEVYNVQGGIDAWSVTVDPTVPRY